MTGMGGQHGAGSVASKDDRCILTYAFQYMTYILQMDSQKSPAPRQNSRQHAYWEHAI